MGDSRIKQCLACGVVFLDSNQEIKKLDEYYSSFDVWKNRLADDEEIRLAAKDSKQRLGLIFKYLNRPVGELRLLDVGAREGFFVSEANKFGFNAIGIDPNKQEVARAQKRGIHLIEGAVEESHFEGEKFDLITIFHVLEHLKNPRDVLVKLKDNLNSDGLLVIEVPNIKSYLAQKHGLSWKFISLEHLFYFSPETLTSLLVESGFEILMIKKRNFSIRNLSINKIFQYFFPTSQNIDRFKMKSKKNNVQKTPLTILLAHNVLKALKIKNLLAFFINYLGRGDHVLFIVRRRQS